MESPDYLILKNKMQNWGPFGEKEGSWLIFSIGNPEEGHGYALPRMADDYQAQAVAMKIALKTGSRYVGHIPWTTDGAGKNAKDWSPHFMEVPELARRIREFLQHFIDIFSEMGLPCEKILIYSGHGGNNPLVKFQESIKKDLNLKELIISTTDVGESNMDEILAALQKLAQELAMKQKGSVEETMKLLGFILQTAGHASHMEHSMCAALNLVDYEKLDEMNKELGVNLEKSLQKWPPVGGLGGYLLYGKQYLDSFGTPEEDRHGLWKCLEGLKSLNQNKIVVVPELGELVLELAAQYYAEIILGKRKP